MNREELIKMFNNKFKELWIQSDLHQRWALRDFIFDTITPEALKSILPWDNSLSWKLNIDYIKRKAKEQFWIDL